MLHGRFPMIKAMPSPHQGIWVDLGGGTGSNLEYFGNNLGRWSKVVVLDLCPSLVDVAKKRVISKGWDSFVDVILGNYDNSTFQEFIEHSILGDACDFETPGLPPSGSVDVVTFSYALTMIPDWRQAIRNGCNRSTQRPRSIDTLGGKIQGNGP
jgi:S-adenosylmethionine-diacylgycerolhomoserine-N-methlytransferase